MRTRTTATVAASALLVTLGAASIASATTEPVGSGPAGTEPAGSAAPFDGTITVGSAAFPENELLAQIYGQALTAAGFDVDFELNIGSREVYIPAIESGEIDLLPEYTGNLLNYFTDPDSDATTVDEQVAALGESLPDGLEVLTPSTAEDKDVLTCTQDAVDEHDLSDFSSVIAAAADLTIGGPPEFEDRTPYGIAGFADLGAEFAEFVPLQGADVVTALSSGEIDCANLFTTDPATQTEGFVAIDDDLGLIPPQAVVPLIRSAAADPDVVAVLDGVSAALDTEILTGLVDRVVTDAEGADVVAADWLASDPQPAGTAAGDTAADDTAADGSEPAATATSAA